MKKKIANRILLSLSVCSALCLSSCSNDDDELKVTLRLNQTAIEYDTDGVWVDVATNTPVFSQNFLLSHTGEITPWGLYQTGFTPARCTTTEMVENLSDLQFSVLTGGGMSGTGTPYLAAYWDSQENDQTTVENRSCRITFSRTATSEPRSFSPESVYVNNNCYTYYAMLNGSPFSNKFAEGDYLVLKAHGVHSDGSESVCSFYLADCKGPESGWFVTTWEYFDLKSLGEVTVLYFTVESSDVGIYGINTPTYFCIDRLTVSGNLNG